MQQAELTAPAGRVGEKKKEEKRQKRRERKTNEVWNGLSLVRFVQLQLSTLWVVDKENNAYWLENWKVFSMYDARFRDGTIVSLHRDESFRK